MPDAIPGATYYDNIVDKTAVCNGITEDEDGIPRVVLEYDEGTLSVPWSVFKEDSTIEIHELP